MRIIHTTMSDRVQAARAPRRHRHWDAWRLLLEVHGHATAAIEADLRREHGLSLRWYDVLLHLYPTSDRGLTMSELADSVVISRSGLTGLVDRMHAAGLVARVADPTDRRSTRLLLSPAGRAAYLEARPTHRRSVARHFLDALDDEGAAGIVRGLRQAAATEARARPRHRPAGE
jgi:DNA-binding MarR family transcriptional regulator